MARKSAIQIWTVLGCLSISPLADGEMARVPASQNTVATPTPEITAAWSHALEVFFRSQSPDPALLRNILPPLNRLDTADQAVWDSLQPVASAVQSAAQSLLKDPTQDNPYIKVEKLEMLHTVLRRYLTESQQKEVQEAWEIERARLSEEMRSQIEGKIKAIARELELPFEDPNTGENSMEHTPNLDAVMPEPEANGFVKTLNNMGYMTSTLDPYSREFARFAPQAPGPALDIGAAYGVATLAALKAGARVIANDIDPRHLEILQKRAPQEARARLSVVPGAFPQELHFEPDSIGAILIARVLHFFDGPTIERAAEALFHWFAPRGKLFVVAETPYLRNFRDFIPIYEARKKEGRPWPGFVEDVMAIAPERGKSLPPRMHFLDPEVLTRVFTAAGFQIEKADTFARTDFPQDLQWDGRESVGMIAVKP